MSPSVGHVEPAFVITARAVWSQAPSATIRDRSTTPPTVTFSSAVLSRPAMSSSISEPLQPDGKLPLQVQGRDSHVCREAPESLIFPRNAKVLNARVIRRPERFALEGKRSEYGDEWRHSKKRSLPNDRCDRAVRPAKSHPERENAAEGQKNGRNRRQQEVAFRGHRAPIRAKLRRKSIGKSTAGHQRILHVRHVM